MADRTVVYRLRAEVGNLQAGMTQASASVKKTANDLTGLNKEGEKTRRGLDTLGSAAGKVGLVAAVGLGAAIVKAADFDQAMSNVQAATHESAAAMEDLRQAALDAGADTAFSAAEAAAGIENLAKAGIATEDILGGALAGALDLAAAGGMEVADAAEAAAGAMAQFKLEGSEATHVADLLAAGAGKAQGDVSDMVMALKQAGTVSSQTGLTIEETTGALAAMAEQSLLGSDAGTSFKTMLASLTPNSDKAAKAMETYNIHAFDAQGNFVGMTELAGQLREGLGDLTDEQRATTLETIFGSDAVRAAAIIYDNGAKGIQNWIDKTNDSGYAAETASIKLDNLRGDLEAFGGSLETALIGTGSGGQGPLRSLTQNLTEVVNAYNELPPAAQSSVSKVLAAGALLGGSIWVGTKLIQGIANTRGALSDLGFTADRTRGSLGRMVRAGAGLATLAGGITLLGKAIAEASGANIDTNDLSRQLEALASGDTAEVIDQIANSLGVMQGRTGVIGGTAEAVNELVTVFGVFGGTAADDAADNIEKVDQALAGLVDAGDAAQAAAAFDKIIAGVVESGGSAEEARKEFDSYALALRNAAPPIRSFLDVIGETAGSLAGLSMGEGKFADAAKRATAMTEAQTTALKEAREQAGETGREFFGLGEKLDKAKVSLGAWLRDLEKQADALRDFRINAQQAAKKGLDEGLIQSLEQAGPAGAMRMKQLADATDAEIDRANRAWRRGQREIDLYVDATTKVPKNISTNLDVNSSAAQRALDYAQARMDALDGKTSTMILRLHSVRTGAGGQGLGYDGMASGGTVPGQRFPYADKTLILAAPGEEVISNRYGQADAFRSDRAAGRIPAYADGGTVGRSAAPVAASVSMAGMKITGTLNTPWGPAQIEGIVDDRIAHSKTYERATAPRRRDRRVE